MGDSILEDLFRSMWGGITPYLMPLFLLAALVFLRIRVGEILADIYYVFTRRYQALCGKASQTAVATGDFPALSAPHQERLERFWDALCNWRDAYRDAVGLNADSLGKVHIANGLLVLNIEKALPFLPAHLRAIADEIVRDCIRERQIWQTAAEKRDAFLKDAATAYAKIDRQIQDDLFPGMQKLLNPCQAESAKPE